MRYLAFVLNKSFSFILEKEGRNNTHYYLSDETFLISTRKTLLIQSYSCINQVNFSVQLFWIL